MKKIFLSFKPEYFLPLKFGLKKYEYRKRFCDEDTIAYLYLSGKSREVIGMMKLGKPIRLDKTRDNYVNYPDTLRRVDEYILNRDIYAIPIISLALFKSPISLNEIRDNIPNFMPPQMYYLLENNKVLKDFLEKRELQQELFVHKHDKIYLDNLAVTVSEMKNSSEYKKLSKKEK